jgi:hypothetical protein
MKIVMVINEDTTIGFIRYEQDIYQLLANEVVYSGELIPLDMSHKAWDGKNIIGLTGSSDIPQWGQNLIEALVSGDVISDQTAASVMSGLPIKVKG